MIERLDANRDRVVECKGPVGHNSQKNSRNRAVKTNGLSVDFECAGEVDRECCGKERTFDEGAGQVGRGTNGRQRLKPRRRILLGYHSSAVSGRNRLWYVRNNRSTCAKKK